jgi:uncharacterized 2Fe-2S/4Fe-4S cluster protein (DUF4445 family)
MRLIFDATEVDAAVCDSLFESAERAGLHIPTSCAKQGRCRECLVEVEAGAEHLSEPSPEESHLQGNFRLACRAHLVRDGEVRCHTLRRNALQIEEAFADDAASRAVDPIVERVGKAAVRDGEVIETHAERILGLAVDLGTTTVVVALFDLESGVRLATQAFENPQRFGGSDVIARIHFDTTHPGRLLQRTLLGYLQRAINALPCSNHDIFEMTVAANTTMRDLLFGLDVHSVGQMPYQSLTEQQLQRGEVETTSLSMPAKTLRLPLHPRAMVYGLPLIGSHVGADAAACLLATGMGDREAVSVLMDVGTNTEVIVGNRERLVAASCPAGPAFEGGGLSCGVPGLDGAIEHLTVDEHGQTTYQVIGGGDPIGICGSGLIDLLSELRRTGRMSAQGRLANGEGSFAVGPHGIRLTEFDINALAQAKGANTAGLLVTLRRFGIDVRKVRTFYLAGGFATHVDVDAAQTLGLLPSLPASAFVKVGNASLQGAAMALRSAADRQRLEDHVRRIEHLRLETDPEFFNYFVDGCQFKALPGGLDPLLGFRTSRRIEQTPSVAALTRALGSPARRPLPEAMHETIDEALTLYEQHGQAWVWSRAVEIERIDNQSFVAGGQRFHSELLASRYTSADAHAVIAMAVSAGHWVDGETEARWADRPDLAVVLDRLAAAVVQETMQAMTIELCRTAEAHELCLLPPYSPGYTGWSLDDQHRIARLLCDDESGPSASDLEVLDSGMVRPKNTQLALFALSRGPTDDQMRAFHPCRSCDLRGCRFRQDGYVSSAP